MKLESRGEPALLVVDGAQVGEAAKLGSGLPGRSGHLDGLDQGGLGCHRVAGALVKAGQRGRSTRGHVGQVEVVRHVQGLGGPPDRLVVAVTVGIGPSVHRQDLGTQPARWLPFHQMHGLGRQRQDVELVVGQQGVEGQSGQESGPVPVRGGVGQHSELVLNQGDGTEGMAGGRSGRARPHRQIDDVDASCSRADGARHTGIGEQFEGRSVMARRLVGAADGHGLVAGGDARRGRRCQVVGLEGVAGQLRRGALGLARRQHLGERRMQPGPLAGKQIPVDGLGQQGVAEGVPVGPDRDEDVGLDRPPQRSVEDGAVEVEPLGQQVVGGPAAEHRNRAHRETAVVIELIEAHQEQIGELGGHRAAAVSGCRDQFLGKKRVALGTPDDVLELAFGQRIGVEGPDQETHVGFVQGAEIEAGDAGKP